MQIKEKGKITVFVEVLTWVVKPVLILVTEFKLQNLKTKNQMLYFVFNGLEGQHSDVGDRLSDI